MTYSSVILHIVFLVSLFFAPPTAQGHVRRSTVEEVELGRSTQGRPITALRIGDGPRKVVLVGDTHGGPEANTYRLMLDVIAHFRTHPEEVAPSIQLYLIPTLNPDGLALETRFNANGVDLNRNMNTNLDTCPENDWSTTVNGAYGIVSDTGGTMPENQVETRLVRDFLLDASAAVFYHSAGGEVFPAFCEHLPSIAFAKAYADAAGYTYTRYYPRYHITGGMHDWAGSMGIASFTPELWNGDDSDTEANLLAIHTVLTQAEQLFPLPEDQIEHGVLVPAIIWRYWKSRGGEAFLGKPLVAAERHGKRVTQVFERGIIIYDRTQASNIPDVQLAPLGAQMHAASQAVTSSASNASFDALFAAALSGGNEDTLGAQLSQTVPGLNLADGRPRLVQYFERARLELDPFAVQPTVILSPLGWYELQRLRLSDPTLPMQLR